MIAPWKLILPLSFIFTFSTVSWSDGHHAAHGQFTVTPITENLHMLQGKGGNIALLTGSDGLLLIDSDYRDMTPALEATLENFGGKEKLGFIINTHWHGDHTQGNLALGSHAHVVAHKNVRQRLSAVQTVPLFKMVTEPYPEQALPNISYQKSMDLHINNEKLELRHFGRGHTDGDTVVFFKQANVVHTGDLFFNGFYPFVDVSNAGNVISVADSLDQVLSLLDEQTRVIPGHGPLADKQALIAFRDMLRGTVAEVSAMKNKGMTLEKIQSAGLSDRWNAWENGFIPESTWIDMVYKSIENHSGK